MVLSTPGAVAVHEICQRPRRFIADCSAETGAGNHPSIIAQPCKAAHGFSASSSEPESVPRESCPGSSRKLVHSEDARRLAARMGHAFNRFERGTDAHVRAS